VRLQLHALAYNLAKFLRTLALPEEVEHWSLTTVREKLVKIGAWIVRHGGYLVFQLAEVAVPGHIRRDPAPDRSAQAKTAAAPHDGIPAGEVRPWSMENRSKVIRTPLTRRANSVPSTRHPFSTPVLDGQGVASAVGAIQAGLEQPAYGEC
jgi:Transposase DDE domain group 1